MSDIKCPYCDKPLHCGATLKSDEYLVDLYQCSNPECESTEFLVGCREFWDILGQQIRTKKQLEIAVDKLKQIDETRSGVKENLHATNGRTLNAGNGFCWTTPDDIHNTLEQITATEQKEQKCQRQNK